RIYIIAARFGNSMLTKDKFEQLFDEYFNDVTAFLFSYTSNRGQVKDWTQDVFIKMWEARDRIDFEHAAFKSYLLTTARNHAIKKLQKQKKYSRWLEQNLKRLTEAHSQDDPVINP